MHIKICGQVIFMRADDGGSVKGLDKTPVDGGKGKAKAKGDATRQANKLRRRQKILSTARDMIASGGFEAFTLSELAAQAQVTVPTIHNLIGKKSDIYQELVEEMVVRIGEAFAKMDVPDPIEAAETFIDNLLALYRADEAFYKAAFVAGERTQFFEHELPTGIFKKSLKLAEQICVDAQKDGYLRGDIDAHSLALQLFGSQRLARQDWMNGYIDLDQYRNQVMAGMLITYAADATAEFRERVMLELAKYTG